jgi:hypothetical protein
LRSGSTLLSPSVSRPGTNFIGASNKATVLRAVTENYLKRSCVDIKPDHGVDDLAMAMSLVASKRGLSLMPAYAKNLLPWSVVSRPLEGDVPTIDLAIGYSKANTSPTLKVFLSRVDESIARGAQRAHAPIGAAPLRWRPTWRGSDRAPPRRARPEKRRSSLPSLDRAEPRERGPPA